MNNAYKLAVLAILAAACNGPRPAGAVEVDASAPLAIIAKAYKFRGGLPPVFVVPPDPRCAPSEAFWDEVLKACPLGLTVTGFGVDDAIYVVRGKDATAWSQTTLTHEAGSHFIDHGDHGPANWPAGSPEQLKIEATSAVLAFSATDEMPVAR